MPKTSSSTSATGTSTASGTGSAATSSSTAGGTSTTATGTVRHQPPAVSRNEIEASHLSRMGNFFQSMASRDPKKRKVKVNENFASDFVLSGIGDQSSSSDEDFIPEGLDLDVNRGKRKKKKKRQKGSNKSLKTNGLASGHNNSGNDDDHAGGNDGSQSDDNGSRSAVGPSSSSGSGSGSDSGSDDDDDSSDDGSDDDDGSESSETPEGQESAVMTQDEDEPLMDNADTATEHEGESPGAPPVKICCVCLSERSYDEDEIVECDSCGISVHEGCYGITNDDSDSIHSTVSSSSTEPWFCDACKASVSHPVCSLCPNTDGIFKESDCGRWVHVVCALYIKGVSFTEPTTLRGLTLYELDTELFGAKPCVLCDDMRLSYTGVCISCDAGLCKVNFHATCAQRFGLLVDASHTAGPLDPDPFYAYCKHHSDKFAIKQRRKNYCTLLGHYRKMEKMRKANQETTSLDLVVASSRTAKKLSRARAKYAEAQELIRLEAWLPSERTNNHLTKSPSAMRRLIRKGQQQGSSLAGVGYPGPDPVPEAFRVDHAAIKKKISMQPQFSNEFVSYFYSRNARCTAMERDQKELAAINLDLKRQQAGTKSELQTKTDRLADLKDCNAGLKLQLATLHNQLSTLAVGSGTLVPMPRLLLREQPTTHNHHHHNHHLPDGLRSPGRPGPGPGRPNNSPRSTSKKNNNMSPSASGSGSGTGSGGGMASSLRKRPLIATIVDPTSPVGQECDICRRRDNFHKLAHCDKCLKFKHITCLNPPLRAVPKKTRFGGWMCSECHEEELTDSNDETNESIPASPAGDGSNAGGRKSTLRDRIRGPVKYEPEHIPSKSHSTGGGSAAGSSAGGGGKLGGKKRGRRPKNKYKMGILPKPNRNNLRIKATLQAQAKLLAGMAADTDPFSGGAGGDMSPGTLASDPNSDLIPPPPPLSAGKSLLAQPTSPAYSSVSNMSVPPNLTPTVPPMSVTTLSSAPGSSTTTTTASMSSLGKSLLATSPNSAASKSASCSPFSTSILANSNGVKNNALIDNNGLLGNSTSNESTATSGGGPDGPLPVAKEGQETVAK